MKQEISEIENDFKRVCGWVDSCTNPFQITCCKTISELFMAKHNDNDRYLELILYINKKESTLE